MTVTKLELKQGLTTVAQPKLGIDLNIHDLEHLIFLRNHGQDNRMADPGQTICLPRHQVSGDLSQLLSSLADAGQVRVKEELTRQHSPGLAGNLIIKPGTKCQSVSEAFSGVGLMALRPLLDFQEAHPNLLNAVTLFPNLSEKGRLKGIVLQFDPRQKGWWESLSEHNWPFFRGLIITALTIGAEEFIDRSNKILPKVISFGRANGTLKHIRFYCDDDNRVFMAIAAGPNHIEREGISQELRNIHKRGRVFELMKLIEKTYRNRRQSLMTSMDKILGLGSSAEEVLNVPFVIFNEQTGQVVSGGVGPGSNFLPFTLSDGMIVHHYPSDDIVPLGIKRKEAGPSPRFVSPDSVNRYVGTLKQSIVLQDLCLGYHPTM